MNPEDMRSAFSGLPMDHDILAYGVIPVLLIVAFVAGLYLKNPIVTLVGTVGWAWIVCSAVLRYGDKALGEIAADHLIVFVVCVPIILGACVVAGLMKGLSGSLEEKRRSKR
jgi:phosphatidylserine synthase